MNWEVVSTVAGGVAITIVIADLIFGVFGIFSGKRRHRRDQKSTVRSTHATVSTVLLWLLSFVNFSVLFGLAWKGDSSIHSVMLICVLAFFANAYASWNQPQMVWKGGFILCSIILVVVLASPWEDEPFEILNFWLGRAVPIYMSALVGGVLGIFFASNRT